MNILGKIWNRIPINLRDIAERAGWTFIQAFGAFWVITQNLGWKAAAIGGVGAGISAVKNYIKTVKISVAAQNGLAVGLGADPAPAVDPVPPDAPPTT